MALSDYAKIEKAVRYLERNSVRQPSLKEVAAEVGLSEFHFQRLFQRWAGVSPKRFLQFLTLQKAKEMLGESKSLLETSLALGLSGTSRLHDLFLSVECMTPGEYKTQARGLTIHWSIEDTPFGSACFAVLEDRGLCGLTFLPDQGSNGALKLLHEAWPEARFQESPRLIRGYAKSLSHRIEGKTDQPLSLVLKGTPFQLKIWEALLRIPYGHVSDYGSLARLAGSPKACRAVGTALAQNPIACLIPCHRVIQSTGAVGQYRWGVSRKRIILALEKTFSVQST